MKYLTKAARRVIAVIATASVTGLIITATLATGSSGTALAADTAQAVPTCAAGDLGVWVAITQGNGALGSIYYPLQFTNLSRHACSLRGFPGVSAIDRNGHQLGSPAGWDRGFPVRTVIVAPGATVHTILRYIDAAVSTAPGCHPTSSTVALRVYPPNRHTATYAAFGLEACSHAGPIYMTVEPIRPGVGTING